MSDVQKPENIQYSADFLDHIDNKNQRDQLAKSEPRLANAIAQFEKDELAILANKATSEEVKHKLLESTKGIYAYHLKYDGPEYYGPEARNDKLAAIFIGAVVPKRALSEQEVEARQQLVKEHPELNAPLESFKVLEAHLSKNDGLSGDDIKILNKAIHNIGNQIRANVYEPRTHEIEKENAHEM